MCVFVCFDHNNWTPPWAVVWPFSSSIIRTEKKETRARKSPLSPLRAHTKIFGIWCFIVWCDSKEKEIQISPFLFRALTLVNSNTPKGVCVFFGYSTLILVSQKTVLICGLTRTTPNDYFIASYYAFIWLPSAASPTISESSNDSATLADDQRASQAQQQIMLVR